MSASSGAETVTGRSLLPSGGTPLSPGPGLLGPILGLLGGADGAFAGQRPVPGVAQETGGRTEHSSLDVLKEVGVGLLQNVAGLSQRNFLLGEKELVRHILYIRRNNCTNLTSGEPKSVTSSLISPDWLAAGLLSGFPFDWRNCPVFTRSLLTISPKPSGHLTCTE